MVKMTKLAIVRTAGKIFNKEASRLYAELSSVFRNLLVMYSVLHKFCIISSCSNI